MLNRKQVLQRDPPHDFVATLTEIRAITGWGTSELCFVLNVARSTLWSIESRDPVSRPNVDDGDAIRKLLATVKAEQAALEISEALAAQRRATCDGAYGRRISGTYAAF